MAKCNCGLDGLYCDGCAARGQRISRADERNKIVERIREMPNILDTQEAHDLRDAVRERLAIARRNLKKDFSYREAGVAGALQLILDEHDAGVANPLGINIKVDPTMEPDVVELRGVVPHHSLLSAFAVLLTKALIIEDE